MNPTDKTYTLEQATLKLMQFCAYRDRSHKEVEEKLREMRMIPSACEMIIIKLIQEDFLNEERFARSFVRGKFRIKKWGRIKIRQHLKRQQISAPNIKTGFLEINEEDYISTCRELAEKKDNLLKEPGKINRKKKVSDYLLGRGFETELVYRITNELYN